MSHGLTNIRRIITDAASGVAGCHRAEVALLIGDGEAVKIEPLTDELSVRFIVKARIPIQDLIGATDDRIRTLTLTACKKALGLP